VAQVSEALGALRTAFIAAQRRLGRPPQVSPRGPPAPHNNHASPPSPPWLHQDVSHLRALIQLAGRSPHTRARLAAVEWATQALPADDLLLLSLCLMLADDDAAPVRKAALAGLGPPLYSPGDSEDLVPYTASMPPERPLPRFVDLARAVWILQGQQEAGAAGYTVKDMVRAAARHTTIHTQAGALTPPDATGAQGPGTRPAGLARRHDSRGGGFWRGPGALPPRGRLAGRHRHRPGGLDPHHGHARAQASGRASSRPGAVPVRGRMACRGQKGGEGGGQCHLAIGPGMNP
jgi:hypothetical protein